MPATAWAETAEAVQQKESVAPSVTVARVTRRTLVETVVVSGSLTPREEVLISPEVDGLALTEILVEAGDKVEKGQVLARLSRTTIEIQLAQNLAQIKRAEATIAQSKAQIAEAEASRFENERAQQRTRTLAKSGYASDERVDQTVSATKVAQARKAAAERAVEAAEADMAASQAQRREIEWRLARTEIRSPVDGIISRRNARIGQIGSMMSTEPMFRIIANGEIELEAEVSDVDMPRLRVGQLITVIPAGSRDSLEARVRLISPEINRQTRLGTIRAKIMTANANVAIGAFARGTVETTRRLGLAVPASALSYDKGSTFLQVVSDGVVRTRLVTTGLVVEGQVEITRGVEEGELVVARAGTFLRDGDKVRTIEVGEETTQ
jgi:HlyD family secretion protein